MKTIVLLAILFISGTLIGQKERMNTFMVGYIGGLDTSIYTNNSVVTVVDTGLVFSERFYCQYSLYDPSYTFNNAQGVPQFHWTGCYILDANTMTPIVNGDYTQSLGGSTCNIITFPEMLSNQYNYENLDFVLTRNDESEVCLIFSRYDPLVQLPIEIYYSIVKFDPESQSWYVASKYNRINEGQIPLYGSIQPVRHANGKDWWIIVGERNTKNWHSYLFDENGIHLEKTSELSETASNYKGGSASISPDGQTYIYHEGRGSFFVSSFDRCSGELSYRERDSIPVGSLDGAAGWVEFSPNGRFAYLSRFTSIWQYDLDDLDFISSKILIATFYDSLQLLKWPVFGGFERPFRATNGRIYHWAGNTLPLVSKIEYPNQKGPDVGWQQDYMQVPVALPWRVQKFADYEMEALPEPCPDLGKTKGLQYSISIFPNPVSSIIYLSGYPVGLKRKGEIIDGLGKQVWIGNTEDLNRGLNVSQLPIGVYYLHIEDFQVKKFAKIGI